MMAQGEDHGRAKLTTWDVLAIRALHDDALPRWERPSIADTSRAFGVTRKTVRAIILRQIWRWL